jgi:poly-gamma-glutamate synthesis protein (capsule biosynthesis protein)
MNIVGNIVIDTPVLKAAKDSSGNYDFAPLFADVKDQLANADITMGTLGTTISGSGSDYTGSPKYNTPDVVLAALKDAGFDVLNLAHPHIFDHGYDGAIGTKSAIDAQSPLLTSAGLFTSKDDYRNIVNPLIPGGKSMPIAVLSYCDFAKRPSVLSSAQWSYVIKNDNVEDTIKPEIKAARETKGAQIVIVLLNWGSGSSSLKTPSTAMQTEAQAIIKAGADLVIGTGPDYMQKLEKVTYTKDGLSKTGIIAYSLGNFVSDNTSTAGKDCSAILHVTFEKDNATNTITIKDASYVPTFVYVDSNSKYSILPAGKYANTPDLLSQLKSSARTRIKKVWEDVKTLFGSSVATPVDVLPPPADATQPGDTDAGQTGETTPPDGTTDPGGTNAPG